MTNIIVKPSSVWCFTAYMLPITRISILRSLGKHQYCECKPSVISIYKLTSKFSSLSYYFYITIYLQDQVVFVDVCR